MTTSGVFSFTVNRDQVIRDAMLNIGKLDEVETPSAQDITDCNLKLNMLIKQWMGGSDFAPSLKVYKRKWGYLFLNNSTNKYTVGPNGTGWTNTFVRPLTTVTAAAGAGSITVASATGIVTGYYIGIELASGALFWTTVTTVVGLVVSLTATLPSQSASGSQVYCYQTAAQQPLNIETAVLRDNNNEDTPLRFLRTVQDYANLPSKTDLLNMSDPTAIYYEFQLTNSFLYTDCAAAQDVTKYIVVSFMEPVQDMVNPADNFDYAQECFLAISWGLSKQIAPMYNMPWTQNMEANYNSAVAIAGHKDAEVTTLYFQPGEE
jgi:hypothetical protein